jgi:hypothetical protein
MPFDRLRLLAASLAALALAGCASPGPPHSPTLNLPALVTTLTATRRGNTVDLRFTIPQRNTDHLPLSGSTVSAQLCRAVDKATCVPLGTPQAFPTITTGHATIAILHDPLPAILTTGAPHLLTYRVQLFNTVSHTAGFSDPTYTVAGSAPPPVENLAAQGSRLGTILSWTPALTAAGEVVLRREDLNTKPQPSSPQPTPTAAPKPSSHAKPIPPSAAKIKNEEDPNTVWLSTTPSTSVLDATALPDEPYRYAAERRQSVTLGGRTLELRSDLSPAILFTLHDIYPPPPPTDLSAAGFPSPAASSTLAVDLIWQPVDDPGLLGYNIYRQPLDASNSPNGINQRLNPQPIPLPAFHDELPSTTGLRYRYSVTSVDKTGNESAPAITTLNTSQP